MIRIENLLNRYKIPYDKNNIIKVFTHNSFSETNNNSRYVFYGQFAIKGKIATGFLIILPVQAHNYNNL